MSATEVTDREPMTDDRIGHLIALATLPGVGPATLLACQHDVDLHRILAEARAGRAQQVPELAAAFRIKDAEKLEARVRAVRRAADDADPPALLAAHRADGRRVLVHGEEDYPERLVDDPVPPALLFAEGDLSVLERDTLAVVGTRNATRAGRDLARDWSGLAASVGVAVVSGLALGIDGAAHEGALAALDHDEPVELFSRRGEPLPSAGPPVGVIASGLDIAYPRRHAALHDDVRARGLLLSETPLGQRPNEWRFPARNRIIAGLADAVLVVESRSRGGSMLTAAEAVTRDVSLLAVPGHPSAPAAAGTNDLLADGAIVARDVEDVMVALGLGGVLAERARRASGAGPGGPIGDRARLGRAERAVLDVLGARALNLDELLAATGLGLDDASGLLGSLEASGHVVRTGAWYERGDGTVRSTMGAAATR